MERNALSIPSGPQLSECNQPLSISPSEASKMLEELVQREEAGLLRADRVKMLYTGRADGRGTKTLFVNGEVFGLAYITGAYFSARLGSGRE
eukprot:gene1284-1455_t